MAEKDHDTHPTARKPCNLYSVIPAYEYHNFPPNDMYQTMTGEVRTDNPKSAAAGNSKEEKRRASVVTGVDETAIHPASQRESGYIPLIWKKKMVTWFQRWDKDGDGVLTRKDFELLDQSMNETIGKINPKYRPKGVWVYMWEHFVSPTEPSHIGFVNLEEWLTSHFQFRMNWNKNPTVQAALIGTFTLLFDAIDISGDGIIQIDEYRTFFEIMDMDKELAAAAFHKLDSDSNGTISKDEFLCAVMSYYCEMTPTDTELADSQFLGPLVDSSETTSFDMIKRWTHYNESPSTLPPTL